MQTNCFVCQGSGQQPLADQLEMFDDYCRKCGGTGKVNSLETPKHFIQRILSEGNFYITWSPGYAEPGYDAPENGVLFANWNAETRYNETTHKFETVDDTMSRIAKVAETAGYETEWYDEWSTCGDCGLAVRTSPDSYSWQPSYVVLNECELLCKGCVEPDDIIEEYLNNPRKAISADLDINLEDHGFELYSDQFENGWHPGQNDQPENIIADLKADGQLDNRDFVFQIDSTGQFDVGFSLWLREK